ncbi:MAG: hypothetical protein WD988_04015 [Candidatus Curtissbacteria bacterium]
MTERNDDYIGKTRRDEPEGSPTNGLGQNGGLNKPLANYDVVAKAVEIVTKKENGTPNF